MKHINLVRAIPIGCAIGASVTVTVANLTQSPLGEKAAVCLGTIFGLVFYVHIRLGHLPWSEKKDGKAHRFVAWLEAAIPILRGPRK